MTWPTHALLGISSLWLLTPLSPDLLVYDYGTLAAVAAFGALLPDLDAAESKIKHLQVFTIKPFFLPATVAYQTLGHRGLLHSLAGTGCFSLVTVAVSLQTGWQPGVALLLGYASHLMADAATKSGIPLLYPNKQRYHLLPRSWRFVTGSQAEEVLLALAAVSTLFLLFSQLLPQ